MIIARRHPERPYLRRAIRLGPTTHLLLWTGDRSVAANLTEDEAAAFFERLKRSKLAGGEEYQEAPHA